MNNDDWYVWTFPVRMQHVYAKTKGEDSLRPLPIERMLNGR